VSCLEALQIACCDEACGTDLLRYQSVELLCAPDTGVTAVLHSRVCLRVGPEVFAKQHVFQAVTASDEWSSSACRTTPSTMPAQMYTTYSELSRFLPNLFQPLSSSLCDQTY